MGWVATDGLFKRMSDRMIDTLTTEVGLGKLLMYDLAATGVFGATFVAMMLEASGSDMVHAPPAGSCSLQQRLLMRIRDTDRNGRNPLPCEAELHCAPMARLGVVSLRTVRPRTLR